MVAYKLTTVDNPSNPFTDYEKWKEFDRENKHGCEELTYRYCFVSDIFSDNQQQEEENAAIESIITNPLFAGIYIRVTKDSKIVPIPLS